MLAPGVPGIPFQHQVPSEYFPLPSPLPRGHTVKGSALCYWSTLRVSVKCFRLLPSPNLRDSRWVQVRFEKAASIPRD